MAANATAVIEVRTTGSNTNGGAYDPGIASAGTDYSQSNTPVLSNIGTVTTATTTLTDTGASFTSALIGNGIYVAGTGITTTPTYITGVPSSTTLTLQTSPGAAGTSVTYNIGGALATLAQAITNMVGGNTIWIKATGTYSIGATQAITPSGASQIAPSSLLGYTTTRGDGGQVTLQASANSVTLLSVSNTVTNWTFANLILDSNSKTTSTCFSQGNSTAQGIILINVTAKNFTSQGIRIEGGCSLFNCAVTGGTSAASGGFTSTNSNSNVWKGFGCVAIGNACPGFSLTGATKPYVLINPISANNTGASSDGITITGAATGGMIMNPVCYNNGRDGLRITGSGGYLMGNWQFNGIYVKNGGYGINSVTDNLAAAGFAYLNPSNFNAFYSNTSGPRNQWFTGANDVTLTGDPFTNGAGGDFSLNNTAGAGAACRAAGWPGVFQSTISTTGYLDIGAAQHQDAGGGNTYVINSRATVHSRR